MTDYPYDLGLPDSAIIPIASEHATAQQWFRLGYGWCGGFHREEAAYCFEQALALDPDSALAHWGLAVAHGPDYNFSEKRGFYQVANKESGWPSVKIAVEAAARAKALSEASTTVSPAHRAMMAALVLRYEWPMTDTSPELKHKYADAMKGVYTEYPDNVEVAIAAAEAIAGLAPWDLYDRSVRKHPVLNDVGTQFKTYVTAGLKVDPQNHWLCHLSVHLNEMGPVDQFNWHAAEVLRTPGVAMAGQGHLLHMPTHLDIQVGAYTDAMQCNIKAYTADMATMKVCPRTTVWIGYFIHNVEFCAWAALYGAHRATALEAATQMNKALPAELIASDPIKIKYYESYSTLEAMVCVRFGMWDEVLKLPFREDSSIHLLHTLFLRFARGVALGAKGDVAGAKQEQAAFATLAATLKPDDRVKHNVDGCDIVAIAGDILAGEVMYREGRYDEAFDVLRAAVRKSDALPYDEPHGWLMSTRQTLAALLSEQGHYEEACTVYAEDLDEFPNNVWSLTGLKICYDARRDPRVADVTLRLEHAAKGADVVVGASCACALSHFDGKAKGTACCD
eukprot:m.13604 g.13604  ORF g.13604 m.13604 type:complete len:564 (+) comp3061_c0_seq1:47-1738(+)